MGPHASGAHAPISWRVCGLGLGSMGLRNPLLLSLERSFGVPFLQLQRLPQLSVGFLDLEVTKSNELPIPSANSEWHLRTQT